MQLELAWGHCRRKILKTLWPGYVATMRATRRGTAGGCPHEVLDPRDVKFYRNQDTYSWLSQDDPFAWRDQLPFARVGLAELIVVGGSTLALAALVTLVSPILALAMAIVGLGIAWFFRNPRRLPPVEPGLVVSPADGRIVTVEEVENEYLGGPAIQVGIFLSIFNVHINRAPTDATVVALRYRSGKFLNALRPEAAQENEQMELRLEETKPPHRPFVVRQIAGMIARRIVCWVALRETLRRGEQIGMIKLGSRTELVFPKEPGLKICADVGQKVFAGITVLATYPSGPVSSITTESGREVS